MKRIKFFIYFFIFFTFIFVLNSEIVLAGAKKPGFYECNRKGGWCEIDVSKIKKPAKDNDSGGGATTTTATVVDQTTTTAALTTGNDDLCQSITLSTTSPLKAGESLEFTSKAKIEDINSFGFWFYNLDNLDANGKPKPIQFTANTNYNIVNNLTVTAGTFTFSLDFAAFDKRDLNWNFYMPKPKNIRVDAYFKKVGSTTWSKEDNKCKATFKVASIDPTPTPNPSCVCSTAGACATACFFDKFANANNITYSNPVKCNLGNDLFRSAPTATDKTGWCRAYYKTKGDANGDGKADRIDYFYYVAAKHGAKLPPSVNVDFNGDGFISSEDRKIIIKSLKP